MENNNNKRPFSKLLQAQMQHKGSNSKKLTRKMVKSIS